MMKEDMTPNAFPAGPVLPEHSLKSAHPWLELQDVMVRDVLTISPEATVVEAANRMTEKNVSCVVVSDASGQVQGILSERDILRKVVTQRHVRPPTVAEVATAPVISAAEIIAAIFK